MPARGARGVVFALLLFCAERAAGQAAPSAGDGIRLAWARAPEASSCPDAHAVEVDVSRRLGFDPFASDARRSIEVGVSREGGIWTAAIEDHAADGTANGSRVVTSSAESCDSLGAAAGLAIALIVRSGAPILPKPKVPPASEPKPCPPAPERKLPEHERHASLSVAGAGALGVLPKPAPGVALLGHVPLVENASLAASVLFLPEQGDAGSLGSYAFGATLGTLGGCYDAALATNVSLSGCASLALGALYVVVFDPIPVGPGAHVWAGGALGPRLSFNPVGPVRLLLAVEALLPFQRRSYAVERGGASKSVFVEPPVGAMLLLGMGLEG